MNNSEKLSNLAVKEATLITHWLNTAAHTGSHFVATQTPLVVHEIIAWGIAEYTMGSVLGLVGTIICLALIYKGFRLANDNSSYEPDPGIALTIIATVGLLISLSILLTNVYDLVFVFVAPRLYIIEQLRHIFR